MRRDAISSDSLRICLDRIRGVGSKMGTRRNCRAALRRAFVFCFSPLAKSGLYYGSGCPQRDTPYNSCDVFVGCVACDIFGRVHLRDSGTGNL